MQVELVQSQEMVMGSFERLWERVRLETAAVASLWWKVLLKSELVQHLGFEKIEQKIRERDELKASRANCEISLHKQYETFCIFILLKVADYHCALYSPSSIIRHLGSRANINFRFLMQLGWHCILFALIQKNLLTCVFWVKSLWKL